MIDDVTRTMVVSLLVALGGWLATTHWIKSRQRLSDHHKRLLIVPAWFPWMGMAMGGPVMQGSVTLMEALQSALSFSVGMLVCVYMTRRKAQRH